MVAGGLGNVRRQNVEKKEVVVGAPLIVLGGPSMLIGLGGGAASSVGSGKVHPNWISRQCSAAMLKFNGGLKR